MITNFVLWFVLVSRNNETIKSFFLCINTNNGSGLRATVIKTKKLYSPGNKKYEKIQGMQKKEIYSKSPIVRISLPRIKLKIKSAKY